MRGETALHLRHPLEEAGRRQEVQVNRRFPPWDESELLEYIYCMKCREYYPVRDSGWRRWALRHIHQTDRDARRDSYYPPFHPEVRRQALEKVCQHFNMSDEMLDGFTCELSPVELLALEGRER
tara:strand:+ start:458 stop:829 length:372 start_codon:yes stop_codon:yes gene_type:complete